VTSLPLVFDAPRAACRRAISSTSPPRRRDPVVSLGEKAVRATQLAHHYFARLTVDPRRDDRHPGRQPRPPGHRPDAPAVHRSPGPHLRRTATPASPCSARTTAPWSRASLMRYPDRVTLCVSSQAGCGMACPFCATVRRPHPQPLQRRIVDQVRLAAATSPERLSNIVSWHGGASGPTTAGWSRARMHRGDQCRARERWVYPARHGAASLAPADPVTASTTRR